MRREDELALVVRVACETEDRDPDEQRAMLAVALWVDLERGAFVTGNRPQPPSLVALVEETYDPSEGRRVHLTAGDRARYERLRARWEPCERCGAPAGTHPADGCPRPGLLAALGLGYRPLASSSPGVSAGQGDREYGSSKPGVAGTGRDVVDVEVQFPVSGPET